MKIRHGLIIFIVIITAFFCADVIAVIWEAKLATLPSVSVRDYQLPLGLGEAGKAFTDYNIIPRRNLFGLKKPAPPPPKPQPPPPPMPAVPVNTRSVNVPPPRPQLPALNLKLKGTITGYAGWERAIVEDMQKAEEVLLKIGEKIQGAELVEIRREEIILNRQGQKVSLKITEESETAKTNPPPSSPPRREKPSPIESDIPEEAPPEEPPPKEESLLEKGKIGEQVDEFNWKIDRQAMLNRLNNMSDLAGQIMVEPYTEGGNIQGFRISNVALGSLFENLGAQEGDIIEEVNGIRLSNINQAMNLYSELQGASELRVRVRRGSGYQFLVYSLR